MRMTGLASGLDIDGMVKKMLSSQQSRMDKAKQRRDLVNWQKDAYRSVITQLNSFQSRFLDILSPTSMLRQTSFRQMTTSVPSDMSQFFTATASSEANNSSVTVNSISQLATAQKVESVSPQSRPISMTISASESLTGGVAGILGQSVSFTVNGETRNITLSNRAGDYFDDPVIAADGRVTSVGRFRINDFIDDLNTKLKNEFGPVEGTARVSIKATEFFNDGGDFDFDNPNVIRNSSNQVTGFRVELETAPSTTVQVSGTAAVASRLGFVNNSANFTNLNSSLNALFGSALQSDSEGRVRFSINEVEFSFSRNTTIRDMINEVNRSSAGVNMSYSAFSDKFTIESTRTGSGYFVRLGQPNGSNILDRMFGQGEGGTIGNVTNGQDAVLTVNGTEIVRASNSITVDGITINLLQETPKGVGFNNTEPITSKVNATQVMDLIKNFVEEYNKLVEELTKLLSDRRPRSGGTRGAHFMPLTEEQRNAMSEREVEQWEEQGRKGLLNNDPTVSRMLSSLRMAVLGSVETEGGGRISFNSIGIRSGSFFENNTGKLNIDEDALMAAIENDSDAVMRLFTQQSSVGRDATMAQHFQRDEASGRYFRLAGENESAHSVIGGNRVIFVNEKDLARMRNDTMGIAQRFADIFRGNLNVALNERERGTLIQKAGTGGSNAVIDRESVFDKRIADMERNITRIQNRFFDLEAKYFKQFSKMETAMTRLNKQSSFLMSFGE
jgi:flagellar hook-associated protein 2